VLFLIAFAFIMSAAALLMMYLIVGRGPQVASNSTLVMRVPADLAEIEPGGVIGQFFEPPATVRGLVDSLRKAKVDSRIAGVVLMPKGGRPLWAKTQEIRDAVVDFKASGKPIVAYLEYGGQEEYYLASACDRVFLMPASGLDLTGLASYELFLRGTLDKIGAYPDMLHIGEYKTASNNFTERGFTAAHREMAESLNTDLYEQIVRGIAEGRKKSDAEVRALVDQGPFLPEDAVRLGLVDDLAYEDELGEKAKIGARRIEEAEYRNVNPGAFGLNRGPRIAVIYAVGLINSGESQDDSLQGRVVGSDTLAEYLRKVRDDRSIRAVVLRVDSPGGSAVASDVIWREVLLTRNQKPLVASMGDLAASGGYYIAMPSHAIVAQPGTLTGSIGVVTGKFVTGGTYDKLGMTVDVASEGRHAEIYSPLRPFAPEERAKVAEQMQAIYDQFVEKAAEGRNTTPDKIDAVAQGRVWTGRQAKQVGLVDELGGLAAAVALAKQRAKIAPDTEVELVVYPPKKSFYEIVRNPFGASAADAALALLVGVQEARAVRALTAPLGLFRRGEPLTLMPHVFVW
jgi:protease-4